MKIKRAKSVELRQCGEMGSVLSHNNANSEEGESVIGVRKRVKSIINVQRKKR